MDAVARCCACAGRDSIISERPGVALAVHQDDFSGLTCIKLALFWGVRRLALHKIQCERGGLRAKKGTQRAQRTLGCAELV